MEFTRSRYLNISVVIPSTGRASLNDSIKSVLQQTQQVLEVIVVDDSKSQSIPSNGHKILRTGGEKGVSYARNLGVEVSSGELIAFLDDDDVWEKDKIQKQTQEMIRNNLDVLISSALVNRKIRPSRNFLLQLGQDPLELLYSKPHFLRSKSYLPTASYIIKKEVFNYVTFQENLTDRENLLFLIECFRSKMRLCQSQDVLIQVIYDKKNSLSRLSLEVEIAWFNYVYGINPEFAKNFLIESSRNFVRIKDYDSAKKMLKLINTKKP